jgi:hypothetical protein
MAMRKLTKEDLVKILSEAHNNKHQDPVILCYSPLSSFNQRHPYDLTLSKFQAALFKLCCEAGEPWTRSG